MFHFPGQKSVKKITKITKKKTNSKATGQPTTSKMSEQRSHLHIVIIFKAFIKITFVRMILIFKQNLYD